MQKADASRRKVKAKGEKVPPHQLPSAGAFLPPGPVEVPALPSPEDSPATSKEHGTPLSTPAAPATAVTPEPGCPVVVPRSAEEQQMFPVLELLAEHLLQALEPWDCAAIASELISRGKLKEDQLGARYAQGIQVRQEIPSGVQSLRLEGLLHLTVGTLESTALVEAPVTAPVRPSSSNTQNRDRVMPAVEMKPRPPNIVLEQLVPSAVEQPNVPGTAPAPPPAKQNRMMPAVPEAQRPNHGTGSTDPNWVSLSSIGEGSNMFPMKRQSEDAGCVSHGSTLEPPGRCTSSSRSEGSVVGSAENRSSLASLDDNCMEEDPVLVTMRNEEQNAPNDAEVKDKTSLFLRNLPLDYGQQKTMEFIDSQGYRDTYDLLLWFPSKKSSHRKTSSVFINFRSCEWAQKFADQFHQWKPDGVDAKLNISTAFYQGFAANFVKYWHLTQEDGNGSICRPFIAEDQLEKVSDQTMRKAQQVREAMKNDRKTVLSSEWTATTLVIRNLPQQIDTQEKAMKWLDESGFGHSYDFLLYFPRKSNSANKLKSLAYVFVNFVDSAIAKVCLETLPQKVSDGMPLSVVTSNIQGREACIQRFRLVADSGRLIPFSEDLSQPLSNIQEMEESSGMLWQWQ